MKVFSGYLKCVKGNLPVIIMYCLIFLGISIVMFQVTGTEAGAGAYTGKRLDIAVVDEDNSVWSRAMTEYLEEYHNISGLGTDKTVLSEALYYNRIQYIVYIPDGFEDKCLKQKGKLEVVSQPGSSYSVYVDYLLNIFVNQARIFLKAGYAADEAVQAVLETADIRPEVNLYSAGRSSTVYNAFRFMPYLYLGILCYSMGIVQKEYQEINMKRRMLASSVSLSQQAAQKLLAFLFVGAVSWAVCSTMGIGLCWREFIESPNKGYIMLNSFTLMLASLALAFFVGTVAKTADAVNGMTNVLSLGLCFLGGVFVPVEMLSGGVGKIGQFLPTWWYSENISLLSFTAKMTESVKKQMYQGFLIQIVFGAACVAAALAVMRVKQQEE